MYITHAVLKNFFDGIVCCMINGACGDGSAGRNVIVGAQQWEHLGRTIGDRIMERSANSQTPLSMFPSQKHHNTKTEIQQHSKNDDGSVVMRGGDGSF